MVNLNKNKYLRKKKKYVQPTPDQMEIWLKRYGIEYKSLPNQFRVCNPDGDTNYSMEVSKDKALVHDFRVSHSQYDGTFLGFVSKYKSINIREAIEDVCGNKIFYESNNKIEDKNEEEEEKLIELPSGSISLRDKDKSKLWRFNMRYLVNERGLSEEVVYRANIHYLGTQIVVPYYEFGMLVFYQSRRQMDKIFNFPSTQETNKKAGDFLYGFDDTEPCSDINLVESIFNALSIGSGTMATGGASLKEGQIKLLLSLNPKSITLAPDNDSAGIKSLIKDYMSLRKNVDDIYYCLPPYNKNKDDQEDWNDLKKMNIDVAEYINVKKCKISMKTIFQKIDGKLFDWKGFK